MIIAAYFAVQKDTVTKQDLALQLNMQQQQLDQLSRDNAQMREAILQLDVDTARIAEHLGVAAHPRQ